MTDFDDLSLGFDADGFDELDPTDGLDDTGLPMADAGVTEVVSANEWWEIDVVETEVTGAFVALPDPFGVQTVFGAGMSAGGLLARRRARRSARRTPGA